MKRLLLFLLLLNSLQIMAQKTTKKAIFDFTNPTSLSPSITPSNTDYGYKNLSGIILADGEVRMSNDTHTGIQTRVNQNKAFYCYTIQKGGSFIVKVVGGERIVSIAFEGYISNLVLAKPNLGTWADDDSNVVYFNSGSVSEVEFQNNTVNTIMINKMTVVYSTPASILSPNCKVNSQTPLSENTRVTVDEFKNIDLSFTSSVQLISSEKLSLKGTRLSDNSPVSYDLSINGSGSSTISLVPKKPVEDGDYQLSIPAGFFRDSDGFMNKQLSYLLRIRENRATLVVKSISPEPGKITELTGPISLAFDDYVQLDEDNEELGNLAFKLDGNTKARCKLEVGDDGQSVSVKFRTPRTYTDKGEWSLVIPEGLIHNDFLGDELNDRWNPEITLTYYIGSDDPQQGDSEMMKKAKALLDNTSYQGMGYPYPVDSIGGSRDVLNKLVNQAEAPSDEKLKEAIGNFYNDTHVVMPTAGNWYNIIGKNADKKQVFLSYDNDNKKVGLTTDNTKASAFKLYSISGASAVFQAPDNSFIHVLTNNPSYFGASGTEGPTAFNKLELSKLTVAGVDSTLTFGLFSMSGLLMSSIDAQSYSSIAAVDYTTSTPSVVDVPTTSVFFDKEKSSGFFFEETTAPDAVIPELELSATSIPKNATSVKLSVKGVTKVSLKDGSKAYLAQGKTKTPVSVSESDEPNLFQVQFKSLTPGKYSLVLPIGTFDYSGNEKPVIDQELVVSLTVSNETEEDFQYTYTNIGYLQRNIVVQNRIEAISDVELSDFVIYANVGMPYSGMAVDTTKEVRLVDYYTGRVYATGHLVPYPEIEEDYEGYVGVQAAKLVLDEPIEPGSIPDAYVSYNLPKGIIGDLNFGRYIGVINDGISVKASECIANPAMDDFVMYVNNRIAGITDITNATDYSGAIYDIQGRKVKGDLKSGIYIQNGKKIYIK